MRNQDSELVLGRVQRNVDFGLPLAEDLSCKSNAVCKTELQMQSKNEDPNTIIENQA